MNELHVQRRDPDRPDREGYTEILSSPVHPFHRRFNPAPGTGLGYDDTKTIFTQPKGSRTEDYVTGRFG